MSMVSVRFSLGAVASLVGLLGCSSGGGEGPSSCLPAAVGSGCWSCLQAHCGSQLSGFESACGDYLSCLCPGGSVSCSAANSSVCDAKAQESTCPTAGMSMGVCVQQNCEAPCSEGGTECDGGVAMSPMSTSCAGPAPLDAGACTDGQPSSYCSATTGGVTSCYYTVGSQQFACSSCSDTAGCAQAASAACY